MKSEPRNDLDRFRICVGDWTSPFGASYGAFRFNYGPIVLHVLSSGVQHDDNPPYGDWEHVSVSTPVRCPTWEEMSFIKRKFWGDDETVIQFHPPKSQHVNYHEFCLHLWRHKDGHKLPPSDAVGPTPERNP